MKSDKPVIAVSSTKILPATNATLWLQRLDYLRTQIKADAFMAISFAIISLLTFVIPPLKADVSINKFVSTIIFDGSIALLFMIALVATAYRLLPNAFKPDIRTNRIKRPAFVYFSRRIPGHRAAHYRNTVWIPAAHMAPVSGLGLSDPGFDDVGSNCNAQANQESSILGIPSDR